MTEINKKQFEDTAIIFISLVFGSIFISFSIGFGIFTVSGFYFLLIGLAGLFFPIINHTNIIDNLSERKKPRVKT